MKQQALLERALSVGYDGDTPISFARSSATAGVAAVAQSFSGTPGYLWNKGRGHLRPLHQYEFTHNGAAVNARSGRRRSADRLSAESSLSAGARSPGRLKRHPNVTATAAPVRVGDFLPQDGPARPQERFGRR